MNFSTGTRVYYYPGEIVPRSGQWRIHEADGTATRTERTCVKGEPFPPTPRAGQKYKLADATRHLGRY